jgi:hypothetical protein
MIGSAHKQANFSSQEVEQQARAWLACSADSTAGAQQKRDVFWDRITNDFHRAMSRLASEHPGSVKLVVKILRSLNSKWTEVNRDC